VKATGGTPRETYCIGLYTRSGRLRAVKIGLATRRAVLGAGSERRLRALQTGCVEGKLKILCVLEGNVERKMHREWGGYRLQGEWFKPAPALLRRIDDLRQAQLLVARVTEAYQ
jgi:hypothetical protein